MEKSEEDGENCPICTELVCGFSICCDQCSKWYHGECVKQFRKSDRDWHCPLCSGRWTGQWQKRAKKKRAKAKSPAVAVAKSPTVTVTRSPATVVASSPGWKIQSSQTTRPDGTESVKKNLFSSDSVMGVSDETIRPPGRATPPVVATSPGWKIQSSQTTRLDGTESVKKNLFSSDSVMGVSGETIRPPGTTAGVCSSPKNELTRVPLHSRRKSLSLLKPLKERLKGTSDSGKGVSSSSRTESSSPSLQAGETIRPPGRATPLKPLKESMKGRESRSVIKPFNERLKESNVAGKSTYERIDSDSSSDLDADIFQTKKRKLSSSSKACAVTIPQLEPEEEEPVISGTCGPQKKNLPVPEWQVFGIDADAESYLQTLLPLDFEHQVTAVQPYKLGDKSLTAVIRLPLRSLEESLEWVTHFQAASFCDYRVLKTFPRVKKSKVLFKKQYRCHHNTYPDQSKKHHKKHIKCTAQLMITLKNSDMADEVDTSKQHNEGVGRGLFQSFKSSMPMHYELLSQDSLVKTHPLEIRLRHWHNHPIQAPDVLRFRRPTAATKEIFMDYFRRGHTPSSALNSHKFELQSKSGDLFFMDHADGSVCPDLHWCYYQYYKVFKEMYGENYGEGMLTKLEEVIEDYNVQCGSMCAKIFKENDDIVIALCTPLMKRVHENLKSSGELVQLDFSGGMDRFATRVGFLVTPSLAGGLPCGVIMSSSETQTLVTKGLDMLQELYPEGKAFFGRDKEGPKIFVTDDATNERNSLRDLYPLAILLLCLFHTLQAFLRYVTASEHGVQKEDRAIVYDDFKKLVYSNSDEEYKRMYEQLGAKEVWRKNKKVLTHLKNNLHPRREEWALCYRRNLLVRGNNTTNYTESTFRVLKDIIFGRLKAFNLVQLFDFFITKLDSYYQTRIASVLNNRVHLRNSSKHRAPQPEKLAPLSSKEVSPGRIYQVYNSQTQGEYIVDMDLEMCSCPVGFTGAPCKHQFKVAKDHNISSPQFHATLGPEDRKILHQVMVGSYNVPQEWYKTLHDGPQTSCPLDEELQDEIQEAPASSDKSKKLLSELSESEQKEEVVKWNGRLKALFDKLSANLLKRPDVYLGGVKALVTSLEKKFDSSENDLISSLFFMKSSLRTSHRIRLQPTAKSRRKQKVRNTTHLGARRCMQTGKPLKSARVQEHGYNKLQQRNIGPMHPIPAKKVKHIAPHSLSLRVDALRM